MNLLILFSIFVILASSSTVYAENYIIDIPFGAFNPKLDTPAQVWYDPPQMFVTVGDTITWYNDDQEGHTVTSGECSGRFGWMSDNFGTHDSNFDGDRFMPGKSRSYKFEEFGTFSYFCTIHPWMEGVVIVEKKKFQIIHMMQPVKN